MGAANMDRGQSFMDIARESKRQAEIVETEAVSAMVVAPVAVRSAPTPVRATKSSRPLRRLTNRQTEIIALLADGLSRRDIATQLGISVNTVSVHTCRIYKILEADNAAHAIVIAFRSGLLTVAAVSEEAQRERFAVIEEAKRLMSAAKLEPTT